VQILGQRCGRLGQAAPFRGALRSPTCPGLSLQGQFPLSVRSSWVFGFDFPPGIQRALA